MSVSTYMRFGAMKQNTLDVLGEFLGLSPFELELIEPEIYIDKVDGIIVKYIIMFKRNAVQAILKKIKKISSNNTVSMSIRGLPVPDIFY